MPQPITLNPSLKALLPEFKKRCAAIQQYQNGSTGGISIDMVRELRARGAKAGMALRPATPVEPFLDMLTELDMLLIMTVEPGFGGQSFLDVTLPKIRRARAAIEGSGAAVAIQVDGGITEETITRAAEAGANVFVAGSAVYGKDSPEAAIESLRARAQLAFGRTPARE